MKNLSDTGRIFYCIVLAGMGLETIYCNSLPYMLLPPFKFQIPGLTFAFGIIFILSAVFIAFKKRARQIALVLGAVFLLIFVFCFVPYQLLVSPNYMHLGDWENSAKEVAFAGGAFAIAGCFPEEDRNPLFKLFAKLIPFGAIIFAITIVSYGILHFQFAKDVATMIPSWIPGPVFWTYLAGLGLLASGIAIILRIKVRLAATMLGTMILIWFIILHVPRVIAAAPADRAGELTSAFLALAYSGIALVIAGSAKNTAKAG